MKSRIAISDSIKQGIRKSKAKDAPSYNFTSLKFEFWQLKVIVSNYKLNSTTNSNINYRKVTTSNELVIRHYIKSKNKKSIQVQISGIYMLQEIFGDVFSSVKLDRNYITLVETLHR